MQDLYRNHDLAPSRQAFRLLCLKQGILETWFLPACSHHPNRRGAENIPSFSFCLNGNPAYRSGHGRLSRTKNPYTGRVR